VFGDPVQIALRKLDPLAIRRAEDQI
jgi:hypothetical protein